MKKTLLISCLLIVMALLVSSSWSTNAVKAPPQDTLGAADTTLAVALSMEELVSQSDVIAIGTCLETKSVWVERSLVTLATVSVTETLKGTEATSLTVVLPGGVDANRKFPVAMSYPGAPRLTPGEDVFLFLNPDTDSGNGYVVTGFSQGKFSIVKDEDGEPMVSRDLTKMSLKGDKGVRRGGSNATPLSSFKAHVKGYLKNK
jgi:hypothetical protein